MKENIAVIGSAWGDEAKGSFTHHLSPKYDWVARTAGGCNAGHTLYRDGKKYVHNLLPSVDFRSTKTKSFLGAGMVIDLEKLRDEILEASKDFPNVGQRIFVDPDAFIVLKEHKERDKKLNGHIGTTNKGIGPAYTDKVARCGKRIRDLFGKQDNADFIGQILALGVTFASVLDLRNQFDNESIIFEGAQGVLLDLNHGSYPFVTSSDCTVAGIYSSGFAFAPPKKVFGIAKAYQTKVGEGPFPTELIGEESDELRKLGNEWGSVTKRPRRVGWLDLPSLRYSVAKGGITHLVLTKLDILNGMKSIPVCDSYYGGEPMSGSDFFDRRVNYVNVPGWKDAGQLCAKTMNFINYVEKSVGVPVEYVSTGVGPKDLHHL